MHFMQVAEGFVAQDVEWRAWLDDMFIAHGTDEAHSWYSAGRWAGLEGLSGFTGVSGTLVEMSERMRS
jgi:hypothetical protein